MEKKKALSNKNVLLLALAYWNQHNEMQVYDKTKYFFFLKKSAKLI